MATAGSRRLPELVGTSYTGRMDLPPVAIALLASVTTVGVLVAVPSDTMRRALLVGCVVFGVWYTLRATEAERIASRQDDTVEVARAASAAALTSTVSGVLTGGAYQVRRDTGATHAIGLHTDVESALADLARMRNVWSPGALRGAVSAVEAFLQRYHRTLMAAPDSFTARQDVPILLDARRDALNALHFLEFGVSHARVTPVRHAVDVVRAACARCMRVIQNKHGVAVRGLVMRPPYPGVDAMLDSHLVE